MRLYLRTTAGHRGQRSPEVSGWSLPSQRRGVTLTALQVRHKSHPAGASPHRSLPAGRRIVAFPTAAVERELRAAELLSRLNVRAPAFYGRIEVDGRAGLVLERVAGNSMPRVLAQHPWRVLQLGTGSATATFMLTTWC